MNDLLSSPPFVMVVFLAIASFLYWFGGKLAPRGEASENKHLPYTGGELPADMPEMLTYHAYFKLALFFAILHVAALVLSTMPNNVASSRVAMIYLVGVGISVFVMTGKDDA